MQLSLIKDLLIGFCLGAANIIPGVSGGTFLLIFKIYERVFSILNNINKVNIIFFLNCFIKVIFKSGRIDTVKLIIEFFEKNDFLFLFKLIAGSMVAIISLSTLMKYLIVHKFSVTYALFFGLILVSIIIPVKMLTHRKLYLFFFIFLGAVATIYVTYEVNPYEKIKMKSELYEAQYLENQDVKELDLKREKEGRTMLSYTGNYTIQEYIYAAFCGAVAVSAMVLPGISGSLMLILLGEYFEVVSAVSGLKTLNLDNIAFLACVATGVIIGGLLFARLVSAVLKKYYNATMAFLIGLMAGSLYALWPFKKSIVMAHQYIKKDGVISMAENIRIYTNINELPSMGPEFYFSIVSFLTGCIIMFIFIGKELKQ